MFNWEKTEDGLYCSKDGHGVARVEAVVVSETNDPNLKVQRKVETAIPKAQWRVHFCGLKMSPAEVKAFAEGLDALPG